MPDRLGIGRSLAWWPRRRLVAVAVAAAIVGTGTFLVAQAMVGEDETAPPPRRVESPGERLVAELDFVVRHAGDAGDDGTSAVSEIPFFEVLPDGAVVEVPLELPEHSRVDQVWPLPDGQVAVLGSRDLLPGVAREDGPSVEGVAYPLMIIGTDGEVEYDQDVRIVGEYPTLIGVTVASAAVTPTAEAIVQRYAPDTAGPARLVAHDLGTGAERVLREVDRVASHGDVAGDLASGRIVLAGAGALGSPENTGRCWLTALGSAAGSEHQLTIPACDQIVGVNAAPDGRFAAVVYQRPAERPELRLRTVDLEALDDGDGAVLVDEFLRHPDSCAECIAAANAGYLGMAWSDPTALRIALMDPLPLDVDRAAVLSQLQDRLHTRTYTVTR